MSKISIKSTSDEVTVGMPEMGETSSQVPCVIHLEDWTITQGNADDEDAAYAAMAKRSRKKWMDENLD